MSTARIVVICVVAWAAVVPAMAIAVGRQLRRATAPFLPLEVEPRLGSPRLRLVPTTGELVQASHRAHVARYTQPEGDAS